MPRKINVSQAEFALGIENARVTQADTLEDRNMTVSLVYYNSGHCSLFIESANGQVLYRFFAPDVAVAQPQPQGPNPGQPPTFEDSIIDQYLPEAESEEETEDTPTNVESLSDLARSNPELFRLLAEMVRQENAPPPMPAKPATPDPMEAALRDPAIWARMFPGIPWGGKAR